MKLEEIRALIEASTPGPWHATISDNFSYEGEREEIITDNTKTWTVGPKADDANWRNDCNHPGYGMLMADAQLAAASRTLLPKLLAVAKLIETCEATLDIWEDPGTLEKESVEIPWGLWRDVQLAMAALESDA